MKTCAWCQEKTDNEYLLQTSKRKLKAKRVPLCHKHRDIAVGPDALPIEKE